MTAHATRPHATWLAIGKLDDIRPLGARVVQTDQGPIAVIRTADDRVFAVEDRCPHRGGPLSAGIVHGDRVTCPLHAWTIDLPRGEAVAPDKGCVRRYPVEIRDGVVYLAVEPGTQEAR